MERGIGEARAPNTGHGLQILRMVVLPSHPTHKDNDGGNIQQKLLLIRKYTEERPTREPIVLLLLLQTWCEGGAASTYLWIRS